MKNWRASFAVPMLFAHVPFQILDIIYTVPFMKGQESVQFNSNLFSRKQNHIN